MSGENDPSGSDGAGETPGSVDRLLGDGAPEDAGDEAGEEVWFSADELARTSAIELGSTEAIEEGGLQRPPSTHDLAGYIAAARASFAAPAGRELGAMPRAWTEALGHVGPGRVLRVTTAGEGWSRVAALEAAADMVETLGDALVEENTAHGDLRVPVLHLGSRDPKEQVLAAMARASGHGRGELSRVVHEEPSRFDAIREACESQLARRRGWFRHLHWQPLRSGNAAMRQGGASRRAAEHEAGTELALAAAEAVRAWTRRLAHADPDARAEASASRPGPARWLPVVLVPRPEELPAVVGEGGPAEGFEAWLEALRHRLEGYGALIIVAGADADPRDAVVELRRHGEAHRAHARDPRWGRHAVARADWSQSAGRWQVTDVADGD